VCCIVQGLLIPAFQKKYPHFKKMSFFLAQERGAFMYPEVVDVHHDRQVWEKKKPKGEKLKTAVYDVSDRQRMPLRETRKKKKILRKREKEKEEGEEKEKEKEKQGF
jgi:hypothetical protein